MVRLHHHLIFSHLYIYYYLNHLHLFFSVIHFPPWAELQFTIIDYFWLKIIVVNGRRGTYCKFIFEMFGGH